MGERGPAPKRASERRRRNKVPGETIVNVTGVVDIPELPARGINPLARAWYESLASSGQSEFFEPSDWAAAVVAAKTLSMALRPGATAAMMGQAWAMMEALLTTESRRRRALLQVERSALESRYADGTAGQPTPIDEYRRMAGG